MSDVRSEIRHRARNSPGQKSAKKKKFSRHEVGNSSQDKKFPRLEIRNPP
jgi:hypothetical protein